MYQFLLFFFLLLFPSSWAVAQFPTINACGQDQAIHVVILGSSTAAGSGPSSRDSTWVNRYRAYLQGINAQNQVTNLARGGTTTYQIMPSWFVAPAGRPATDTTRNVTQAISLQPDAIIINMPSNDVATGVTLPEQLNNYRVMVASADSAQIPVWVCTTQPRNFSSVARRALQVAARDSIFAEYGVKAIDFWSGFATPTDSIQPIYDSGDGVHLNDAAHAILFSRVAQKALPNVLADTALVEDLVALELSALPYNLCGDTITTVEVVVGNLGQPSLLTSFLELSLLNINNNSTSNQAQAMASLPACGLDTLSFDLNTSSGVHYDLEAYIFGSPNPNAGDTTNTITIQTIGRPNLQVNAGYQCQGDSSQLLSQGATGQDRVYWYNQLGASSPSYTGETLPLPPLNNDQTFYAQIARGPFHFFESLYTAPTTNINWNGVAFDLVATDTLIIDSLDTKLATAGLQTVMAYYKNGSHVGHLNSPSAWTLWDSLEVQVTTAGEFYTLLLDSLVIPAGDTVGVYLHLLSSTARLSYNSNGSTAVYDDGQLQIIGGSGVSHTFGALYSPRNWAGAVHYHYGNNPAGVCQSALLPVPVEVSTPVDLGNDTTVANGQTVVVAPAGNYASYLWNNGSTAASVMVDSSWAVMGQAVVVVTVTDANGCSSVDSLVITFSTFTTLFSLEEAALQLYPNPSTGLIVLEGEQDFEGVVQVVNAQGTVVFEGSAQGQQTLDLGHLPRGCYWLLCRTGKQVQSLGVVLE